MPALRLFWCCGFGGITVFPQATVLPQYQYYCYTGIKVTIKLSILPSEQIRYDGGRWVAWTPDGSRIVAIGASRAATRRAAERRGSTDIKLEWVRPANERYFGTGF